MSTLVEEALSGIRQESYSEGREGGMAEALLRTNIDFRFLCYPGAILDEDARRRQLALLQVVCGGVLSVRSVVRRDGSIVAEPHRVCNRLKSALDDGLKSYTRHTSRRSVRSIAWLVSVLVVTGTALRTVGRIRLASGPMAPGLTVADITAYIGESKLFTSTVGQEWMDTGYAGSFLGSYIFKSVFGFHWTDAIASMVTWLTAAVTGLNWEMADTVAGYLTPWSAGGTYAVGLLLYSMGFLGRLGSLATRALSDIIEYVSILIGMSGFVSRGVTVSARTPKLLTELSRKMELYDKEIAERPRKTVQGQLKALVHDGDACSEFLLNVWGTSADIRTVRRTVLRLTEFAGIHSGYFIDTRGNPRDLEGLVRAYAFYSIQRSESIGRVTQMLEKKGEWTRLRTFSELVDNLSEESKEYLISQYSGSVKRSVWTLTHRSSRGRRPSLLEVAAYACEHDDPLLARTVCDAYHARNRPSVLMSFLLVVISVLMGYASVVAHEA